MKPRITIQPTATPGQSIFTVLREGDTDMLPSVSLQMPTDIAEWLQVSAACNPDGPVVAAAPKPDRVIRRVRQYSSRAQADAKVLEAQLGGISVKYSTAKGVAGVRGAIDVAYEGPERAVQRFLEEDRQEGV